MLGAMTRIAPGSQRQKKNPLFCIFFVFSTEIRKRTGGVLSTTTKHTEARYYFLAQQRIL
jgi:hypothetical protein